MANVQFTVGDITLTRVGYVDVDVEPERVGLTADQVAAVPWAEPTWAGGTQLRVGAAAWVIRSGDAVIVVDPAQAADDILRSAADAGAHQEAFAGVLAAAGVPRDDVTHAIATHVEGIGMFAWRDPDGSWSPFFPNAALVVTQRELDALDAGAHPTAEHGPFDALRARGIVDAIAGDRPEVAPGVSVEVAGGHTPGHAVVRVRSGGDSAVMVGHLAVSPLHLATGECPQQHPDPALVEATLTGLRASGALLIGPLWPAPGAGRWVDGGLIAEWGTAV